MEPPFLPHIDSSAILKDLTIPELKELAQEIRNEILYVLSINGGHLSSNLGVVELTLALHRVFESPKDKFIFDVSHQTYVHKILTGRRDLFSTIRQYKGLSGFADPSESAHDHFYAGHAGTALSLALGVARRRDQADLDEHVIPILGDASLTCGLTLEACNNMPKDLSKCIVVLNDNNMSISKNVGHIKQMMSRFLNNPTSNKLYHQFQDIMKKVPGYGELLARQGQKFTESIKHLVSPAAFFGQFGMTYVGPIDGHDISKLITTFQGLKGSKTPVIVHVMTTKGKGLSIAAENPTPYHGAKPFDLQTGKFLPRGTKITFPKIFGNQILKMTRKNNKIMTITPAMSAGSCLDALMEEFPDHCIDVGIAEGHAVTFAGGIAYERKLTVFVVIYATFLQRAFDNLFHDVCLQGLPVIFALDRAYMSAGDGSTHHGIYDIGFLQGMPNMVIAQPRNGKLLRELMESAPHYNKPTAIRYPNLSTTDDDAPTQFREVGKGELIHYGKQIILLGLGHMIDRALEVKKILNEDQLDPTIVDPIFVKPLDEELLDFLVKDHTLLVTIEEHAVANGLGSIINNFIMKKRQTHLTVINIGIGERFPPHGKSSDLYKEFGLDALSIAEKIRVEIAEKVLC